MKKKMHSSKESGVTIIELVVTMVIISIIALTSSGIIISMMQILMYTPREMKAKNVAHEVMEIIIEGESSKRGARCAGQVVDASPVQFTYTFGYPANTDRRNMRFRWDAGVNKIYRSYTGFGGSVYGQEEAVPYYATAEISIEKPAGSGGIFSYYDVSGNPWTSGSVNDIRRVEINIVVQTGSGLFQDWEGSFKTTSGVEIKGYI